MKLRIQEPDAPPRDVQVERDVVRIGRDASCEVSFDPVRFPKVSGVHAELRRSNGQMVLIHRSQSNRTLLNDQPLDREATIKAGDRIRLGFTGPTITVLSLPRVAAQVATAKARSGNEIDSPETQMAINAKDILRGVGTTRKMHIGHGGVLGRDPLAAQFLLDHPLVSRVHARLTIENGRTVLADCGSANGTFVNGQRLTAPHALSVEDTIDIGPYSLVFDGQSLTSRSRANDVQLIVSQVGRVVQDTAKRRDLTLLHDVTLVLNPAEFVAIIGPSGSGKSTLLGVISGRTSPSSGTASVNGQDLHRNFAVLKEDLAVVPQTTSLHESLTVDQTLAYTASLRLPPDTNQEERRTSVDKIVDAVGLTQRRRVRIRQLSGGQLKRAGLGCELLSEPSLLFLDEVTSGLDEHADGEMMRLFRRIADQGKTIACVTHNLSHIEENCHLVAVLTVGGRLAFFGRPVEALDYFAIERLADVYTELDARSPEEWATAFRRSPQYANHIQSRMPQETPLPSPPAARAGTKELNSFVRQLFVLVKRNVAIWRNDTQALAALFGQACLVALLLCIVFGSVAPSGTVDPITRLAKIRNLLFLVGISSFWLGCNNAVKEIVKERRIYQRERDFNLIPEAYLASKLLVMFTLGIAQAILLGILVYGWCGMSGSIVGHLAILCGLSFAGTSLGLGISALARTEEVAVAAVPIAIIPQIILTGVVAHLAHFPELLARMFVTVYWGQKDAEQVIDATDRLASDFEPSLAIALAVVCLHACIYLGVAWYGSRWMRRPAI
jgi:ABC-type multidrug transport system ATPase subunit